MSWVKVKKKKRWGTMMMIITGVRKNIGSQPYRDQANNIPHP